MCESGSNRGRLVGETQVPGSAAETDPFAAKGPGMAYVAVLQAETHADRLPRSSVCGAMYITVGTCDMYSVLRSAVEYGMKPTSI